MSYPQSKKTYPTHKSQTFVGKVIEEDGKKRVQLHSQSLYNHFVFLHCKVGDFVTLELICKRPKRTEAQNNYYHLYLSLICLSSGHTMTEIKAWIQKKYLSKGITEVFGENVRIVTSSADLNISEMCELIERLAVDTEIPPPGPTPFKEIMSEKQYQRLKALQNVEYKNYNLAVKIT